ncbi:hypothetical protein [Streptomyces sp. NPDC053755]|uniref:hypothetical protein n=1 Tax=Streptomyces sp. NPDC053755 TaxID=3155815 RepID=UPI00343855EA
MVSDEVDTVGTAVLLAAAPTGRGRAMDAASVLPALAAVPPSVLTGTPSATVVELADPLDPQTVLTRLRAAAATRGPLAVYLAGQLHLDRRQHLPHLALARTTSTTLRYTGLPWHWLAGELAVRGPGTTTVVADLVAEPELWQRLTAAPGLLSLGPGPLLYGRVAPAPRRGGPVTPDYLRAFATIWRSGARPSLADLHEQAAASVAGGGEALLLTPTPLGGPAPAPVAFAPPASGSALPPAPGWSAGAQPVPASRTVRLTTARTKGATWPVKRPAEAATPTGAPTPAVTAEPAARTMGEPAAPPAPLPPIAAAAPDAAPPSPPSAAVRIEAVRPVTGAADEARHALADALPAGPPDVGVHPADRATAPPEAARGGAGSPGAHADAAAADVPPPGPDQDEPRPERGGEPMAPVRSASVPAPASGPVPAPASACAPAPAHAPVIGPAPAQAPVHARASAPAASAHVPAAPVHDPHREILAAAQAGRHGEAVAVAAAWEREALRRHGARSQEAVHWMEVRADLARLAGDPARSCELWISAAQARLGLRQGPGDPDVEGAVDRAHHQWEQIEDVARARELGPVLYALRGRVPGRQPGALAALRRRMR